MNSRSVMYRYCCSALIISCAFPAAYYLTLGRKVNGSVVEDLNKTIHSTERLITRDDGNIKLSLNERLGNIDSSFSTKNFFENLPGLIADLEAMNDDKTPEVLWRLGKALYHSADLKKDAALATKGVEMCWSSLALNDRSSEAHKWYAKLITWNIETKPINEKIILGRTYKKHIDIALSLKKNDTTLLYMDGEYNYKLSSVTYFERLAAQVLFSELPKGSYSDAMRSLKKTNDLDGKLKHVKLYLAKVCEKLNDFNLAKQYIKEAHDLLELVEFNDRTDEYRIDQSDIDSEIRSLYSKYF